LQEVLRAVFRKIGDFRQDRPGDSFRGWLRTITINKAHDRQRMLRRQPESLDEPDDIPALPDDSVSGASEQSMLLRRALSLIQTDFRENTWKAFWLTTVEGQPTPAVAEALGMTVNAVFVARAKVLKLLKTEFKDLTD
jgi:RNA polymerase sigma-70 factor (ECF subfamily)